MIKEKQMRLVFGETLCELANEFPEVVVLDADVSSSTQTKLFNRKFPQRFFNFGIAEADMVSAAAGMSTFGLIPVVSTFAFLLTMRTGDPVRSLIAYNNLNVKLAAGYSGLSDFADGASHQSVLDLSVIRAMPNFTVLAPSDIETTRGAIRAMLKHKGPVYLRLSRDTVGSYHGGNENFEIGKANVLKEGKDITIAVCGSLLREALSAAEILKEQGIMASVLEFATIKPFDKETLLAFAKKTGGIVTVEENNIIGGLGSAVAEAAGEEHPVKIKRIGIRDTFGESGSYKELLDKFGLTAPHIVNTVKEMLK